ncbi:hypothetical protein ACI2KR_09220 [Pseudomonas luteola]
MNIEMPESGAIIISTAYVDNDTKKPVTGVYQVSENGNNTLMAQLLCQPKTNYFQISNVLPFEIDKDWVSNRVISFIDIDAAKARIEHEHVMSNLLYQIRNDLKESSYFKFEADALRSTAPRLGHYDPLRLAKLNNPISVSFGADKTAKITHISCLGELVTGLKDGLKSISYLELNTRQLKELQHSLTMVGCAPQIEKHLVGRKTGLLRNAKQDLTLPYSL